MAEILQNTPKNIDWKGTSWVDRGFSYPSRIIRLGASFSGIGAIEYAFKRLGIPQTRGRLYCIGFRKKTCFFYPAQIPLKYRMYDFMEDYSQSPYYHAKENIKFPTTDEEHAENVISGKE